MPIRGSIPEQRGGSVAVGTSVVGCSITLNDLSIEADLVDVEVAVRRRRATVEIVEEPDGDIMRACTERAVERDVLGLPRRMGDSGGEGAADLMAIHRHDEVRIALVAVSRHLEHQRVRTSA